MHGTHEKVNQKFVSKKIIFSKDEDNKFRFIFFYFNLPVSRSISEPGSRKVLNRIGFGLNDDSGASYARHYR